MSSHNEFDESDEDDFNPAPADMSDDEHNRATKKRARSSSHGGDDDEPEQPKPKNRRRNEQEDEDDEEDEDEDEENEDNDGDKDEDEEEDDEEEEDVRQGGRQSKHRRDRRAAFFDIEAEVDDEDEAEDDEGDGEAIGDFIENDALPDDDFADSNAINDDRRHRELDAQRELNAHMDAEEQAELLKKKYGHRRTMRGLGEGNVVPRRLLLPSVNDPRIWSVRCKEGKEREVVFSIIKRMEERATTKDELLITAAFERGGKDSVMKGRVYVEAIKQTDIMAALTGIMNVYPHNKVELVGIKDMPALFRVAKAASLERGAWVRLTRPPKHKDDLAQVLAVTENGLEARVRFIPRIDYESRDTTVVGPDGKRKRIPFGGTNSGVRPPPRLFSESEARKHHFSTNDYFENGFQIKDIRIQLLRTDDVNPSLEEVARFTSGGEDGSENLDLTALAASLSSSNTMGGASAYLPGDVVEVYEGEQRGVIGRTAGMQGDIVTINVTNGGLAGQTIDVPVKGLRKRFSVGDHVKVIGGSRFRDDVGMVVKIDADRVTLLTDQTHAEVTVFSRDLREASDSGGQTSLGQYSLLDLVELDSTTVGVVVKVDRESLGVLDQNGDGRTIMPSQIRNLIPKRKTAVAADRGGSEIRLDDVVREHGGQHRQGKVIHIHRSWIFLHTTTTTENAGVFVTRASNVNTVAAKGGRVTSGGNSLAAGPDLSAMNPALRRTKDDAKAMPPPQKSFGRDRALGQTVIIRKGPYKGLLGIVKETTDTNARIELHTKNKTINVPKAVLSFKDKNTGADIDIGGRGPRPGMGGAPGARPGGSGGPGWQQSGSRTPMAGDRTPAWGARTPAPGFDGGKTPAWKASGGYDRGNRTPAWGAGADGSRTVNPYDGNRTAYGGGSRTPAWQSGARTPAVDSFSAGAKTPGWQGSGGGGGSSNDPWGSGAKTPYGGYGSAPTPAANPVETSWGYTPAGATPGGAFDAPTPGAGLHLGAPTPGGPLGGGGGGGSGSGGLLNAPTPGALNAPTPGAFADTPALGAPTPGAYGGWGADSAPTPAAGGYYSAPTPGAYGSGAAETPAAGPQYADDDDD